MRPGNTEHALKPDIWSCTITSTPTEPGHLPGDTIRPTEQNGKVIADFLKDVDVSKFKGY